MNQKDVLAIVDHTLLLQTATWEEIKAICDDGVKYETASVCIPTCYVKQAKEYMQLFYLIHLHCGIKQSFPFLRTLHHIFLGNV